MISIHFLHFYEDIVLMLVYLIILICKSHFMKYLLHLCTLYLNLYICLLIEFVIDFLEHFKNLCFM